MLHAKHVSELVERGATAVGSGEVPAVYRRRLVQGNIQYFAANRRGRAAIGRRVADSDFGFAELIDLLKLKADSNSLPFGKRVTDRIPLHIGNGEVRASSEEAIVQ